MKRILDENDLLRVDTKFSKLDKQVTNLEQAITPSPFVTDDAVAYGKIVPDNALPYAEVLEIGGMCYAEGDELRSAPVTEVKSIGKNFVDMERFRNPDNWEATSGYARSVVYMGVLPAGTYIASAEFNGSVAPYLTVQSLSEDGTRTALAVVYQGSYMSAYNRRFTIDKPAKILLWTYWGELNSLADTIKQFDKIQIVRGETDTEYEPYKSISLPIPEAVRSLDGYGLGAGACRNSVDFAAGKYTRRVAIVDLGELTWWYDVINAEAGTRVFASYDLKQILKEGTKSVACTFPFVTYGDIWRGDADNAFCIDTSNGILGRFTGYTDAASFKEAMSGVMLAYELAEPEVVDISDWLSADNYIEVFEGGTVFMDNENKFDVPSSITYQIKEVSNES